MAETVPSLFRELSAAGRFDYWGTTQPLTAERRVDLMRTRVTEVLWWDSIEWDRTVDEVATYVEDGFLPAGLVPFAGNGVGDHYCLYPPWQEGAEPPVVLFEHDAETSGVFAADFAGCLVRCLLQHFATHTFAAGQPDRVTLWVAHAGILRPHLGADQAAVLDDVGTDPTPERCAEAEAALGAAVGGRSLENYPS